MKAPLQYIEPDLMARATGDLDAVAWDVPDRFNKRRQVDGCGLYCILFAVFCWSLFLAQLVSSWGQW